MVAIGESTKVNQACFRFRRMLLSERIAEAIEESGKTVAQIATACGITPQGVYAWTKGDTGELMGVTLARLASATGYEALWIAEEKGPKKRADKPLKEPQSRVLMAMEGMQPYQLEMLVKIADTVAKTPLEQTDPAMKALEKKSQ